MTNSTFIRKVRNDFRNDPANCYISLLYKIFILINRVRNPGRFFQQIKGGWEKNYGLVKIRVKKFA